jgi:hypothetical protein
MNVDLSVMLGDKFIGINVNPKEIISIRPAK